MRVCPTHFKSRKPLRVLSCYSEFLHASVVILFLAVAGLAGPLGAQEQPLVTDDAVTAPLPIASDPFRKTEATLQELAKQPLPALDGQPESDFRMTLEPVNSLIEDIPRKLAEERAFKYRRARIRLTSEARLPSKTPFRLMEDLAAHPELYWGRAVAVHGTLMKLQPIPGFPDEGDFPVWREGSLKLWNQNKSVRFLARQLPEDLPTGNDLDEPAQVIGYVFSLAGNSGKSFEPLIVARRVSLLKPQLDPQTFTNVKDRTIGLPEAESDAYYRTLLHAKLMEQTDLEKQAEQFWKDRQQELKRPRPLFVDMFKSFEEDPQLYRGQAVTLVGTLRKLREITVDPLNDFGLETLYEAWIFADDSQSNPTVVVFAENSGQLPEGDNLNLPVEVTGYVFKMYGYESRDKEHPLRVAPMLLAKTIKKRDITEPAPFPVSWVAGALALLCLGIVLFVWSANKRDKQFREQLAQKDENEQPPRFDNLSVE